MVLVLICFVIINYNVLFVNWLNYKKECNSFDGHNAILMEKEYNNTTSIG